MNPRRLPLKRGSRRRRPRPRRKVSVDEELPPDYEYPKRYTKPSIQMLEPPTVTTPPDIGDRLRQTSALLEETLNTFGIEARVTGCNARTDDYTV